VSLDLSMVLPADLRSSGGGPVFFFDLEKWKISNLSCLITRPDWLKRDEIIL